MNSSNEVSGTPLSTDLNIRVLNVFLYRFFRGSHAARTTYFDKNILGFSEKKKWQFKYSGPFYSKENKVTHVDRTILSSLFFKEINSVFWLRGGRIKKRIPPQVYCSNSDQISEYFLTYEKARSFFCEAFYIFDSSFSWYIMVNDSLRTEAKDDYDFTYFFMKK